MKKLTTMISVLFLGSMIAMAGCKKDDDSGKAGTASGTAAKKPADPKAGTGSATGGGGGGGGTGLAECDAYAALMDKYMSCDKIPQAARDAAKQGLDGMKASWTTAGMPDDAKKAANDACKSAADAVKQGASAMGCSL